MDKSNANKIRKKWFKSDYQRDKDIIPAEVTELKDIAYTDSKFQKQEKWHLTDIYYPLNSNEKTYPVIVNVHGGGWFYGDKELYSLYTKDMASHGFAVVNFNYRLSPEYKYPAGFSDVCALMNFISENAEKYKFNLSRLFMSGDSCGAQLVTQYCIFVLSEKYSKLFPNIKYNNLPLPKKVLLNCGIYNIEESDKMLTDWYLPKNISQKKYDGLNNMLSFMNDKFPETYLMTSVNDVFYTRTAVMHEQLRKFKINHIYKEYGLEDKNDGHVFHLNFNSEDGKICRIDEIKFLKISSKKSFSELKKNINLNAAADILKNLALSIEFKPLHSSVSYENINKEITSANSFLIKKLNKKIKSNIYQKKIKKHAIDEILKDNPELYELLKITEYREDIYQKYCNEIINKIKHKLLHLCKELSLDEIFSLHDGYKEYRENIEKLKKRYDEYIEKALSVIVYDYKENFPCARNMLRHFIIHVGPTNSGKTYDALKAFRDAETGIYLAPLRLLAYEIYDETNKAGVPCNMVTGEEIINIPDAEHQASTIEMLDTDISYEVAVIDEAQMTGSRDRGGYWTQAIVGVRAEEIHICTAPHGLNIIKKLIDYCGDTYEVLEHERLTPLFREDAKFKFPKNVKPKDALIVFSKRAVISCSAELQQKGIKPSVIYGALPYEVRQREVEKFINGETDVVVATDAIGMGLNLPVKRVILLENCKFDGISYRTINTAEIQQIIGRAGRKGIYESGYYNSQVGINIEFAEYNAADVEYAYENFPRELIKSIAPLSAVLKYWKNASTQHFLRKIDITHSIELCKKLESRTSDKNLIYSFITMPFDENNNALNELWYRLFLDEVQNQPKTVKELIAKNISINNNKEVTLDSLEEKYKKADLICYYIMKFRNSEETAPVVEIKKTISNMITDILKTKPFKLKVCSECGQKLPWNHPYKICESCYSNRWIYRDYDFYW